MRRDVQDCAEFLRLPGGPSSREVIDFYAESIGLPIMRDYPGIIMMWAGEATAFELKFDTDPTPADDTHPATAQFVPVFRSHDLAATRTRLTAAGHTPVAEQADTFYVRGPDGLLTGFRSAATDATDPTGAEALRRWRRDGQPRLPNTGALAPELQHLCRIVLHASDVERSSRFYAQAYGLDDVTVAGDSRLHDLGELLQLEIAPGGAPRPLPGDRFDVRGAILLRTHDLDAVRTEALAAGARSVGAEVFYEVGVRIQYLADPDGAVLGFIQRTDAGGGEEDYEAMRRWTARSEAARAGIVTAG